MTFEEALASPGPLVAAWEAWTTEPLRRLFLYSVAAKPQKLAETAVGEAQRDEMSRELHRRGIRVGTWVPLDDHFWCVDEQGFALWSMAAGLELEGKDGDLRLTDGRRIASAQIRSVVFFVEDDWLRRGVRLELVDGSTVVLAQDEDRAALADPTYNGDNLSLDAAWAEYLGLALAKWLGKPYVQGRMGTLSEQLRALGLDGSPAIAESAELDGGRFDAAKTLARLELRLEFYQRELDAMYAFAAKWNAPMEEVTDKDGEYREAAARLRDGIALLEEHLRTRVG